MKKNVTKITVGIITLLLAVGLFHWYSGSPDRSQKDLSVVERAQRQADEAFGAAEEKDDENKRTEKAKAKKARYEYFFRLLRDPATNAIPNNIRQLEMQHAKQVPSTEEIKNRLRAKNPSMKLAEGFNWRLAGPPAVGGRTRALAIDQRNPDVVLAGGVSGGLWKSNDGGDNWELKTPGLDNFSVTGLAQHPNNPDTWYYVSGEFIGNSASSSEISPLPAPYYGTGVFRSTDNGENWSRIPNTSDVNTTFSSKFDYISRIVISPTTGSIFIASNGVGISRSADGNNFDEIVLGGLGEHTYAEVAVASDGRLYAVLSTADAGASGGNPGVYISDDDGQSWDEITPSTFPEEHFRSVVDIAPSDPDVLYILTQKNTANDASNQGVSFHKIDISDGVPGESEDRSANLPDFGSPVGGLNLQGGYNMTVSVKPDDPDFVTLGGTNLYRSFDGFATAPDGNSITEKDLYWIGGYSKQNNVSQYPSNHADQHVQVYDPTDPNRLWAGHDGGLSVTDDVTASSVSWIDRNDGYIVTQFYDASIAPSGDDNRFMGGTQDNGTPFFEYRDEQNIGGASSDISSGDGGYSFFTENYIYVSNQQGANGNNRIIRFNGDFTGSFAIVQPAAAQTSFFISPYTLDPNDDGIMYYPGGTELYRNTEVDEISSQISNGATQGWEVMEAAGLSGHNISALEVSTNPTDILYYAGSSGSQAPVIRKITNASTSNQQPLNIDIPGAPEGAFVHDIAVNPANANDIMVVMSNYNITGLYHSSDGGTSWESVEGNLEGDNLQGDLAHGPSLRSATIVPSTAGPIYLVATSTGVYSSQGLSGEQTTWGRESAVDTDGISDIGFSVVENITSRFSNGDVAVGTHGRGMFVGRFQGEIVDPAIPMISLEPVEGRAGTEVTVTASNFNFNSTASDNDIFFGGVRADVVSVSPNQLTVIVPRATLDPMEDDRVIFVSYDREEGTDPQPVSFTIIPPGENSLEQNFPNPFSTSDNTMIPIGLQYRSEVSLVIYDISGRQIDRPLDEETYQAGTYNVPINMSGKASGIYIYRIIIDPITSGYDTFVDSQKFTFIK